MKIQRKWKFVMIIAVAIVLLLVARSCGANSELNKAEAGARTVFAPFTAIGNFFGNFFDFDTKKGLEKELKTANKELATYKAKVSISKEITAENQRLRKLLDLKKSYSTQWDMCVASVSGREIDNWYERLLLNKGSADGIKANMAVVNEDGLVGRTVNITEHTSEVLLIIDAKGSLGGMTKEGRIPGVLTGIGGGKGLLNMTNLPFNAEIQLNDTVVTSGEGGIFPAGLLIGSVVKVSNSLDGLSKVAIIEPFCDFDTIREVLILIPGKEETTKNDDESVDTSDTSTNTGNIDNTDTENEVDNESSGTNSNGNNSNSSNTENNADSGSSDNGEDETE